MTDIIVSGILAAFISAMLTTFTVNGLWQSDCDKLGAHVVMSKVYECKERK